AVQALAFSPDGQWLASGGFGKTVLLDAQWEITNQTVTSLTFAPTGSVLAIADRDTIEVYDVSSLKKTAAWQAHKDIIYDLKFSQDAQKIVTAGGDRLVKVWDVTSRKEIATLEGHTAQVLAVAFNSNATQVVSGGSDHNLIVWDVATREKIM